MREKSIDFQKLIPSIVQREEEEEEKKYSHAYMHIYIYICVHSTQYTRGERNVLIMYILSQRKESLIKVHSWDKCAVRCILKQILMRAALNANSFRCYFVSAKCPFAPFSGPFDHPAVPFPSNRSKMSWRITSCCQKSLFGT